MNNEERKVKILEELSGMKVTLEKLDPISQDWVSINSGYLVTEFEVGKPVAVGSISSRDFWYTTEVVNDTQRPTRAPILHFTTLNSTYRIRPLHADDWMKVVPFSSSKLDWEEGDVTEIMNGTVAAGWFYWTGKQWKKLPEFYKEDLFRSPDAD